METIKKLATDLKNGATQLRGHLMDRTIGVQVADCMNQQADVMEKAARLIYWEQVPDARQRSDQAGSAKERYPVKRK